MQICKFLFSLLIFPGFAFTFFMAFLVAGLDRKWVARMQRRVGPPIKQAWYDYLKCLGKETIIPRKSNKTWFLLAPVLGVASVLVTCALLPVADMNFMGTPADLIVILYLLTFASTMVIIGSAASGSPFAGVGLSREMVSMISYELPLVLILLAVGKVTGTGTTLGVTFNLTDITAFQAANGPLIIHWSMIPAAIAMLLVIPCEVGQQPFDVDEAETEICEGVLAEYSGRPLARFKLMHNIKMYMMSALFVVLFLNIQTGCVACDIILFILFTLLTVFVSMSLPHAVSARFRVEQVFKFYWTFVAGLAAVSLILVWCGI